MPRPKWPLLLRLLPLLLRPLLLQQQPLHQQQPLQLLLAPTMKAKKPTKERRKSTARSTRPQPPTDRFPQQRKPNLDFIWRASSLECSADLIRRLRICIKLAQIALLSGAFLFLLLKCGSRLDQAPLSAKPATIPAKSVAPSQWLSRNAKKQPSRVLPLMRT